MKKLWLCLYFPMLQLDSTTDSASTAPIIVLDAKKNLIKQLNQTAQQQGIQLNMGLGTAAALAPSLQVEPYNPDIEGVRLKHIAECLYLLTSDIALLESNKLLLRIDHMLRLYGDLSNYWLTLQSILEQQNVHYHFATGNTALAAKLLADRAWNTVSSDRQLLQNTLLQQPIQATELHSKTVDKLQRVGIQRISDLAAIPLAELGRRFDIQLLTYMGRLLGELQCKISFYHPEPEFHRSIELLYEITNSDKLLKPLGILLDAAEQFFKLRNLVCQSLHISLQQREMEALQFELQAASGEYRASSWLSLLSLKLETIKLQAPVYAMSIKAGVTQPQQPDAQDLFQGRQGTLSHAQLISLLQAKLGEQAVQGLGMGDDHRVSIANQLLSPFSERPSLSLLQSNRPFLFLAKPILLQEKVSVISGPERLESGWWDDASVLRDYFIARTPSGQWCWIFRTPTGQWYLQGYFS